MAVYEKVIEYCDRNGITIMKFEKLCKLANGTVGKWKDQTNKPSITSLLKIEENTGVKIARWIE